MRATTGWIILSCATGDARWQRTGSCLGCGPGRQSQAGRGWRTKVVVPLRLQSCVTLPKRPFFFGRPGLGAKRNTRIGWPIDVEADDIPQLVGEQGVVGELESLDAIRRSLYAPSSGGTEPGEMPSPHAAHRSLESSRRAAPRPRSSPPFHYVRRERRDARRPALLINQTVDIFLDETLVAIDAPSAWTRPFVA